MELDQKAEHPCWWTEDIQGQEAYSPRMTTLLFRIVEAADLLIILLLFLAGSTVSLRPSGGSKQVHGKMVQSCCDTSLVLTVQGATHFVGHGSYCTCQRLSMPLNTAEDPGCTLLVLNSSSRTNWCSRILYSSPPLGSINVCSHLCTSDLAEDGLLVPYKP